MGVLRNAFARGLRFGCAVRGWSAGGVVRVEGRCAAEVTDAFELMAARRAIASALKRNVDVRERMAAACNGNVWGRVDLRENNRRGTALRTRQFCADAVAAAPAAAAAPGGEISPKVEKLLDQVLQLNMIEVKQLSAALKEKLGLSDMPMGMSMPMGMPMGGMMPGASGAGAAAPAEAEKPAEKTSFNVVLASYDAAKKIGLIKEVRAATGLGLKEAKALVDAAPKTVKDAVSKEEAEELKTKLEAAGAIIELA
ncbi:50S ribosomal protein L7/L12 [Porphyridium purpureum]|uniref:50S ribosomal protein L12, chloroplastic n=1 Tax=Porphyridium purpureum TaxID=35688 RepID=A0A5J4YPB8_PORPP|nr:50S ribosomal protein L7/L12 [Porphyridium purpureum]|eukprot:POR2491..scf296_7